MVNSRAWPSIRRHMLYSWTIVFEAICPLFATALFCEGIEDETSHSLLTWPMIKLYPVWRQPFQTFSRGHHKKHHGLKNKGPFLIDQNLLFNSIKSDPPRNQHFFPIKFPPVLDEILALMNFASSILFWAVCDHSLKSNHVVLRDLFP